MKTISIKTYLLLLSLSIVIGISAVVFFIVMPNVKKISTVNGRLNTQEATRLLTEHASRGETTDAQIADAETRLSALEKKLLSTDSVLETITTFETLADAHGLKQKIDVVNATTDAYTLSLGIVGTMSDEMAYFADIQKLPFAVLTPTITWDRRAVDQSPVGNGQIAAHTVITIYVAHLEHKQ